MHLLPENSPNRAGLGGQAKLPTPSRPRRLRALLKPGPLGLGWAELAYLTHPEQAEGELLGILRVTLGVSWGPEI